VKSPWTEKSVSVPKLRPVKGRLQLTLSYRLLLFFAAFQGPDKHQITVYVTLKISHRRGHPDARSERN